MASREEYHKTVIITEDFARSPLHLCILKGVRVSKVVGMGDSDPLVKEEGRSFDRTDVFGYERSSRGHKILLYCYCVRKMRHTQDAVSETVGADINTLS